MRIIHRENEWFVICNLLHGNLLQIILAENAGGLALWMPVAQTKAHREPAHVAVVHSTRNAAGASRRTTESQ